MQKRLSILFALAGALALALPSDAFPRPTPPGPGNVLAVHQRLLGALDRGDGDALRACFSTEKHVELLVVDEDQGRPLAVDAIDGLLGGAFTHRSKKGTSLGWKSSITSSTTECPSGSLASGTIEFERRREIDGRSFVRRYRSTALLRHEPDGLRIFHWHVSPAEPFDSLAEFARVTR